MINKRRSSAVEMKQSIVFFIFILIQQALCNNCSLYEACTAFYECLFNDIQQFNLTNCPKNSTYFSNSEMLDPTLSVLIVSDVWSGWRVPVQSDLNLLEVVAFILGKKRLFDHSHDKIINLNHFDGFDMNLVDKYDDRSKDWKRVIFVWFNFAINFHSKGQIVSLTNCSFFDSVFHHRPNLFNQYKSISFAQCAFSSPMCPSIFKNADLDQIAFTTYLPRFVSTNYTVDASFKTLIIKDVTKLDLNPQLLNVNLFYNTTNIQIVSCSLYNIDQDLFKSFPNVRVLELNLINLRGFLHSKGLSWTNSMNSNIFITSSNTTLDTKQAKVVRFSGKRTYKVNGWVESFNNYNFNHVYDVKFFPYLDYNFPDEDLCLFKQFPYEKMMAADVRISANCTCTLLWLFDQARYLKYMNISEISSRDFFSLVSCPESGDKYSKFYSSCQFDNLLTKCDFIGARGESDPYFTIYDVSHSLTEAKLVLIDYLGPVISVFGFVTNLLTILTLVDNYRRREKILNKQLNKEKEMVFLKQPLYQYMLFTSVINSASCLMYLLDYSVPCLPEHKPYSENDVIYMNLVTDKCLKADLIISIFGSILKLMSNFTQIMMLIHRYILTGKNHSALLVKISLHESRKALWTLSIVLSLSLSSVIYFQKEFFTPYFRESSLIFSDDYTYNHYFWSYYAVSRVFFKYDVIQKIENLPFLLVFTMIHDLFSYFLFCLICTCLDLMTIKKLREVISKKETLSQSIHVDRFKECETRGIVMIVLSSFANFLLRAPELISVIFFYIFTLDGPYVFKTLCFMYKKCLTFVDLANIFYLLSLSLNFFFYVKFNKGFERSFKKLFRTCQRNRY